MGINFEIRLKPIEEVYPDHLGGAQISDYLAQLKATPFKGHLSPNEILVTSDTVVWHKDESLAKPSDPEAAIAMLNKLSDDWHEVITSVCFTTSNKQLTVNQTTKVRFRALTAEELQYYVETCRPFDKAGGYGIQEWIGLVGIEEIRGTYSNVVGLPTQLVYKTLLQLVD